MNIVRHYFNGMAFPTISQTCIDNRLFDNAIYSINQDGMAIFGTPNQMQSNRMDTMITVDDFKFAHFLMVFHQCNDLTNFFFIFSFIIQSH